jgi:hypothetical protein
VVERRAGRRVLEDGGKSILGSLADLGTVVGGKTKQPSDCATRTER